MSDSVQIGTIGEISHIEGMLAIGGDVVAGNKTVIQYITQQTAKKIVSQPYKFLSSYSIADRDIFFGREVLIEQLAGQVPRHKVLLINGASGSGKSSLINAGLIPRLAENGYTYLSFRDYSNPLYQLQQCLIETKLLPTTTVESLLQTIQSFKQRQMQVVFIFDQFERFFVNVPTSVRLPFIEMIKVCLENLQPTEMNVIFSMREEFFGQFQREFEKVIRAFLNECERINLEPLSRVEARAAIIQPLTLIEAKIGYDETFVDEVLLAGLEAETGEGINPPHLQIVCNQLYQAAHQQVAHQQVVVIDAKLYAQLGGTPTILRTYLDDCVNTVAGHQVAHIQILRSLLKQMIETGGTRKFVTLEQLTTSLPEVSSQEIETLLERLQDARVIETRSPAPFYSLSHEFMVGKVKDWYDAREMEHKKAQETLEHGLAEWQNSGALLNEEQVERIRCFLPELTAPAQQLLRESERVYRARRRTMRWLRASLVAFMVLTMGFGIFSYLKAREAKQQAQVSKLRQLGAQAILAAKAPDSFNGHFDRALLLAMQAFQEQDNLETRGTLLRVMNSVDRNPAAYLQGHLLSVSSVVFSPDGKLLASGSWDNTVILWEVATLKPVAPPLSGHHGPVKSIAFSPDGQMLASGSDDRMVILWEVATQKPLGAPLQGHNDSVRSVAFSPDGKILASGSDDSTVMLWELATHKPLGSPLQGHNDSVRSVAFSLDGQILASGSDDKTIRLWEVATHQPLGSPLLRHSSAVTSVAFSPDGQILASGSWDKTILFWKVATHQPLGLPLLGHTSSVMSVAFSADGQTLASGSDDNTIILWQVASHQPLAPPLQGHSKWVSSVAFSPDGQMLASGSMDKSVVLWDVTTQKPLLRSPLQGHRDSVSSVAFSSDGQTLASGSDDKTIRLWKVATQKPLGSPLLGHRDFVMCLAFSPDGQILASGSNDNTIILWEVATQKPLGSPLQGHRDSVRSVAFSPDGKTLASGSNDNTIILWEVATQKPLGPPLPGHTSSVTSVTFSPDGQTLASGSFDNTIRLWEVATQKPLEPPLRGDSKFMSVVFSPDGQMLASGSFNNTVRLWEVATRRPIGSPLFGHSDAVMDVAFSPDGQTLASGSWDKTVILWEVATQKPLESPLQGGYRSSVRSIAFSPDGKTLASGNDDKTIILWNVEPRSWYQQACRIAGRNLTLEEWQRYLQGAAYQKTCAQFPSGLSLALIQEGEQLAEKAESLALEAAVAKFNEAFSLDPGLKEHPLYNFSPAIKANKIAASALINQGESFAQEEKLEEAVAAFKRAKELDVSLTFDPPSKAKEIMAAKQLP